MGVAAATERYLLDYHHRHPGSTAYIVGDAVTEVGGRHWPSSYAWLADQVPRENSSSGDPIEVLDLACGSGEVLRLLAERGQEGLNLIGIDMSPSELAVAAEALGNRARLIEARAQSLPLPSASVDVIVSHLALMLMEELDAVVAAMHRVLKPGGKIACVVWGGAVPGDSFEVFGQALRGAMAQEALSGHQIGDRRTHTAEGLATLFGACFDAVEVCDISIRHQGSPEEIWSRLAPNYDVDLLSPAGQAALREDFLRKIVPLSDKEGTVGCSFRLRALTARRD
jgi:SAM-dependent methyltransferase